ncbi:hypothetical protein BOX15_Mlig032796g1 [Macrostomum lignano]|uniref:Hexosyltransferase n=1 Tax=Macrostomum lignano TaxID=282301 RepID=A0A267F559_9PLAT|nr:hypothetical protein BOX15_Mlig032796g1 [Macrostomum lignano]
MTESSAVSSMLLLLLAFRVPCRAASMVAASAEVLPPNKTGRNGGGGAFPGIRADAAALARDAAPAPARDAAAPAPARDAAAPAPARYAAAPARDAAAAPAGSPSPVEAFRSRCWRRGFSPTSGRPTDHTPEPFAAAPACRGRLFLVAIVHSAVGNAAKRHLIRRTWASISNIGGRRLATVFVVGRSADQDENRRLDKESEEFGDLVVANFRDHYRNLTYKNLYGIRWALEHCSGVRFVLKTDDDVLVNTFRLVEYISDRLLETRNFFYCMTAKQETRMSDPQYKWFVSPSEWPVQEYPLHCKGLAYLFSADLLGPLHLCAQWRNYFWIDDIFVTGAVAHECLGAALLHWAPGWDFSYLNPSLTGLQLTQAVVFNEFDSEPVPALTVRAWQTILYYS